MALAFNRPGVPDQPIPGPAVVTERIYWDETKTRLLAEGHPEARFLAYAEGTTVPAGLAGPLGTVEQVVVETAALPARLPDPTPPPVPNPGIPEKSPRRTRTRQDRQIEPGVVADTSIDGEAHVLVSEPGSPLRNGVDK